MILVVSTHGLHDHENGNVGNPQKGWYFMCSIIIARPPYLVLPFSSTNKNCWLGKMCIQKDWGKKNKKPKNFLTYMSDSMYQKMDPIRKPDGSLASESVKRIAKLTRAYTIDNSADAYLPDKNPVQS